MKRAKARHPATDVYRPRRRCSRALVAGLLAAGPAGAGRAAHAAMVIDANTGEVLHEQSADEPRIRPR